MLTAFLTLTLLAAAPGASTAPLLPESTIDGLAGEISGESAKRNL